MENQPLHPLSSPPLTPDGEPDTRDKLLEAAGRVFAARGFRDATVREICTLAGANIAAVNYHFGDKLALYREVIKFAGCQAMAKYPPGQAFNEHLRPDDKLTAFIRNYLDRLLDEGRPAWHGMLIAREMVDPTSILDELVTTFVNPQYIRLTAIVSELLGPSATPERVRLCVTSVVGQCLFYKNCRPIVERIMPEHEYTPEGRERLAAHITAFSLAGIERIRSLGPASTGVEPS